MDKMYDYNYTKTEDRGYLSHEAASELLQVYLHSPNESERLCARDRLLYSVMPLIIKMCAEFYRRRYRTKTVMANTRSNEMGDYVNQCTIWFLSKIHFWEPDKGSLTNFVSSSIWKIYLRQAENADKNGIVRMDKEARKKMGYLCEENLATNGPINQHVYEKEVDSNLVASAISTMRPRLQEICLHLAEGGQSMDIARKDGCKPQRVHQLKDQCLDQILEHHLKNKAARRRSDKIRKAMEG